MKQSIAKKHIKTKAPVTMAYSIRLPIKDVKILKSHNINISNMIREMIANEASGLKNK